VYRLLDAVKNCVQLALVIYDEPLRYDTIVKFNVDSKPEYSALSSTRSQKKTKTNKIQCPFNTVQVKIREGSPEGIRVTMEERICERDELSLE